MKYTCTATTKTGDTFTATITADCFYDAIEMFRQELYSQRIFNLTIKARRA